LESAIPVAQESKDFPRDKRTVCARAANQRCEIEFAIVVQIGDCDSNWDRATVSRISGTNLINEKGLECSITIA
jgi:hypothetical protein